MKDLASEDATATEIDAGYRILASYGFAGDTLKKNWRIAHGDFHRF